MESSHPERPTRLVVFSTLFPNPKQPNAGLFIRERMFRVGKTLPLMVVAPVPWFPLQRLVRLFRPHFRPGAPRRERQDGFDVHHPRFLSVPGLFKAFDGLFLALSSYWTMRQLRRREGFDVIDAHFAYPDGYAATLLGKWLGVPVTITLRGTEARLARSPAHRQRLAKALRQADHVFCVSRSLMELARDLGAPPDKLQVVGNGVDTAKFAPLPTSEARMALSLEPDAPVLISVGALVERKGFHRVIDLLPQLRQEFPGLVYLIVGGASPEGDIGDQLRRQADRLGVADAVRFLGAIRPDQLKRPLSAADVFVLSTRNEGWANVFLEAMACGLPVVTTDVGGNREVVSSDELGTVVRFEDQAALLVALRDALGRNWDRAAIRAHAEDNNWDGRVESLVSVFAELARV